MRYLVVPDGLLTSNATEAARAMRGPARWAFLAHSLRDLTPGVIAHDKVSGKSVVTLEEKSIELT